MQPVIIESPFAANEELGLNVETNLTYLRAALRDCLHRGEAPFASHGLYTLPGVLDDTKQEERDLGIAAGFAWRAAARKTVVYQDLGVTPGVAKGIRHAEKIGHTIEYRSLSRWSTGEEQS